MEATNHFSQLLEIARQLPPFPWDHRFSATVDTLPLDEWPSDEEVNAQIAAESPIYLAAHTNLIDAARRLLIHFPCEPPCENRLPASTEAWRSDYFANITAINQLGQIFARFARDAVSQQNWPVAIAEADTCLRLSQAVRRGGMIIDYLTACGIEEGGIDCLRKIRRQLPVDFQRELIRTISSHESQREPYDNIADRDEVWTAAHQSEIDAPSTEEEPSPSPLDDFEVPEPTGYERVRSAAIDTKYRWLYSGTPEEIAWKNRRHMQEADLRNLAFLGMLRIELALFVYHAEHQKYPRRLCALAPKYLRELPLDPHANRSFLYRRQDSEFVLYGSDEYGDDHGGHRGDMTDFSFGLADLFLDLRDSPPAEEEASPPGWMRRLIPLLRFD